MCSLMDHCCCPDCGQHPLLAVAQPAPPPEAQKTPPARAQQAQTVVAQQAPPTSVGYHGVPLADSKMTSSAPTSSMIDVNHLQFIDRRG
jgi:hypothetical protein